jgi:two-component system sensor histidine kinase UhpB
MASNAHFYQVWRLRGASTRQQDVGCDDTALAVTHFFRTPLIALLVAVSYYAGTRIGFFFTPAQTPIATFWPPNAILLAAFLLTPRRMWWALLLAVLPVHLLVQMRTGIPVATVLGWFVGNAGEALLGAVCIRYFEKDERSLFNSVRGVTIFLGFGVLVAPVLTSFLDAAVVMQSGLGSDYWSVWTTRLFSNMLANITVAPTIVLFGFNGWPWLREARPARYIEAGLLALGIVLAAFFVFGGEEGWRGNTPALLYGLLPFLLWASARFGLGGLNASLLTIALISMWNLMHGRDPFISGSLEQNALALEAYLVTIGMPLMILSAVILEMQRTSRKLIDVQEQERYRIGRELHDDIGQQLVLIGLEVEGLMSDTSPTRLYRLYGWVSSVAKATRDLSHELHPPALSYVGLAKALRSLCRQTGEAASISLSFIAENVPPLAGDISLCLYRVAQEALQNIAKHSDAQTATLELRVKNGRALLRIVDDGAGITPEQQAIGSIGLTSIRERLTALDGTLKIISTPMKGTIIEGSVPLKRPR